MRCENKYALTFPHGYSHISPCTKQATTSRRVRSSLKSLMEGAPKVRMERMCEECARAFDDAVAEARWEARVS